MRVISKLRLKQFWRLPGRADAEGPLQAWHTRVNHRSVDWLGRMSRRTMPPPALSDRALFSTSGGISID